jgi:hypothetical protein
MNSLYIPFSILAGLLSIAAITYFSPAQRLAGEKLKCSEAGLVGPAVYKDGRWGYPSEYDERCKRLLGTRLEVELKLPPGLR